MRIDAGALRALQALYEEFGRHDSAFWRRAARLGAAHGPEAFVRHSPPAIGLLFAAVLARQRRAVEENLRRIRGEHGAPRDPRARAREAAEAAEVFMNFAASLTEAFVLAESRFGPIGGRCENQGVYLKAASEGRGVIVATAHTGGWHAAGALLRADTDADVLVVMDEERDARAQAVHDEAPQRAGIRVTRLGDDPLAALPLLAHLRRGGVVAVQVDRVPRGMRAREVSFCGGPLPMPEGPLKLAAVSGAPIVPIFVRRLGFLCYEVVVHEAIRVARRPSEAELDEAASAVARAFEGFVRAHPTQWFHFGRLGG